MEPSPAHPLRVPASRNSSSQKTKILLTLILFTFIIPWSSGRIRHHRVRTHGPRMSIRNRLFLSHRHSPKYEDLERYKRDDAYYPNEDAEEYGPWSDWVEMTGCSRTCGGGVLEEVRTCDVEGSCGGNEKRYTSCNVQECPPGSKDFRAEQCARYNEIRFEKKFYTWVPYTKSPRRCELNCQPEGERFYYRHAKKVVDGTRCDSESRDVCVNGNCVPVGCDLIIGSKAEEDKCRVCKGNGTNCVTISGVIDWPVFAVGYNDIVLIPKGATTIHIEEVTSSNNILALRNAKGDYYLNGDWTIQFPNATKYAGTTFHYERKHEGFSIFTPEVIRALGPTTEPLYLVLLYQERNPGIRYEFSVPKEIKETDDIVYEWRMSSWGDCSVSCGGGHMTRNISCVRSSDFEAVDESLQLCDTRLEPEANKSCNEHPCQATWETGNWTTCTSECGTPGWQFRHVYCGQRVSEGHLAIINESTCEFLVGSKPESMRQCNVGEECPTYHIADWSYCDKLCGIGKQYRKVTCHKVTNSSTIVLEDSECSEEKPEAEKECDAGPCIGTDWITSEWSECRSPCGAALKTRDAFCVTREGERVSELLCGAHRRPEVQAPCDEEPECSFRWYYSEWSECSEECGVGVKTRHVFCGQFEGDSVVSLADEAKCDPEKKKKKMAATSPCAGEQGCDKEWLTSMFGKCSKTCGGGQKKRFVFCFQNETNLGYTKCDKSTKPFEKEQCNTQACTEDELMGLPDVEEEEDLEWCDAEEMPVEDGEILVDETPMEKAKEPESSVVEEVLFVDEESEDPEEIGSGESDDEESDDAPLKGGKEDVNSTMLESNGLMDGNLTSDEEPGMEGSGNGTLVDEDEFDMKNETNLFVTEAAEHSLARRKREVNISEDFDYGDIKTVMGEVETDSLLNMTNENATESSGEFSTTEISETSEGTETNELEEGSGMEEGSAEVKEMEIEEGSGVEEEIMVSKTMTEVTTSKTTTAAAKEDKVTKKKKKCKPRPKEVTCDESEFGCCQDGKSPAEGPFQEGCKVSKTCNDTEFGCCPDDVSPAQGERFLGCPGLAICDNSLFGCCADNFTEATGPEGEGCENLIEFNCKETRFGCCPDGVATATGKDFAGCEISPECEESGSCEPCNETVHGCCPDGITPALGEDMQGCPDAEGSAEGSGTEAPAEVTTEFLPDCARTPFGCCEDNYTAAHGKNFEGCCLASPFGCCPDHISNAKGPNFEGCGCNFTTFGCCPDNDTVARGPDNAGCGCEYTEFGCCPDNHTPSVGEDFAGCPCNTYEFGCCPDGISIAQGPKKEGCGCAATEHGCCEDQRTPAKGPNGEGCGCEASQFGCCADGVTPARGELFEGCEEEPPIVPGEVCGFDKDRGPCRDFTVRFYFDINYGGCTRFWYGGCEGNLNRFETLDECETTCVEPEGLDACRLPPVAGPCTGAQPSWFHDSKTQTCQPFEYRGCLGNNNRFQSKEACEEVCVIPEKTNICLLEMRPGPCRGNFSRWYYDQTVDKCRPFTFGGCKGNSNNFLSEKECLQRCIRGRSQDICTLPKASGFCDETLPRWYFDYTESRCMPFYYTGCDGNTNRFMSRGECEATCYHEEKEFTGKSGCTLPLESGSCDDYQERYYYDLENGRCQTFLYGGCEGNKNNFQTIGECQLTCEDKGIISEPESFPTESCFLEKDAGNCHERSTLWYYDSSDGACKQFLYNGCDGNLNRFKTRQECENRCGEVQDICQLPVVVGPCSGSFKQYYYDATQDDCLQFDYSGCQGNRNRFDSLHLCRRRCQTRIQESTTSHPGVEPEVDDRELPGICRLPMYTGNCRAAIPKWYYDPSQGRCIGFTYGGCSGNANRFKSVEQCERECGTFRNRDVCNEPVDAGTCEGTFTKWYHDPLERICKPFYFSGCDGNGNRFSSQLECESECIYHDTILPDDDFASSLANVAICELPREFGPCSDGFKRWYFSTTTGTCEGFVYGGCGGNLNRFKNFNTCVQFCHEASLKYRTFASTEATSTQSYEGYGPCFEEKHECEHLHCPYGITRRVTATDCEKCSCYDPCENMICFQGSKCSVELVQSRTEVYEAVRFEAVCREVNKPGKCPVVSGEITRCDQECENDAGCSNSQKCCYNGCAYVCADPVTDRPREKPGHTSPPEESGVAAVITHADTTVEVQENDVVNLVCQARGKPTPAIGWYKDGNKVDVTSDGRFQLLIDYSLQIVNTKPSDAGTYRCVANNGIGVPDERDVELKILDPTPRPVDIIPPQEPNPVVTLGNPVILRCWSVGWPRSVFSWWRGETMMPKSSEKYEALPLGGLRINFVTIRDLGPYTCHAYNGKGRPATSTFIVRALGPLKIVSPADKPFLQYIVNPPRIPTSSPESTTTTFPARTTEERVRWPRPPTYPTRVPPPPPPPRTTYPPEPRKVKLRANIRANTTHFTPFSDIVLSCDVEGYPPPAVYWYHNNELLENSERVIISSDNTLTITAAEKSDEGYYKCELRNEYGEASHTITITIEGVYVHPNCTDNPHFADCSLVVKAKYCVHDYYSRFCCRSCTLAGQLPSFGTHLQDKTRKSRLK